MSQSTKNRTDEAQSVVRTVESIVRNAELDADRVAAFLRRQGVKPVAPSALSAPSGDAPTGPIADMLLNLAAALRIRSWERAGLSEHLHADAAELPSFAGALAAAVKCFEDNFSTDNATEIPRQVFRTLLERFAEPGRTTLGTDVVLNAAGAEDFLDHFAAFLLAACKSIEPDQRGGDQT